MHVFRHADLELPGQQGQEPGRAVPPRALDVANRAALRADLRDSSRHAGHCASAVQLAIRGACVEWRSAWESEGAAGLARGHPCLRHLLRGNAGVRVYPLRAPWTRIYHEPVRIELL